MQKDQVETIQIILLLNGPVNFTIFTLQSINKTLILKNRPSQRIRIAKPSAGLNRIEYHSFCPAGVSTTVLTWISDFFLLSVNRFSMIHIRYLSILHRQYQLGLSSVVEKLYRL